jgi:mono/diheme cytochrome c family protein
MKVYRVALLAGSIDSAYRGGDGAAVRHDTQSARSRPAAVVAGQRLYDQGCAGCHAAAGQGSDRAPALTGRLAHGSEDGDVFHSIREGVPGTAMTPHRELSDQQTWQLVSYIKSLAGNAMSRRRRSVSGDATAGAAVFTRAQCATCHEIDGVGGIVGPDCQRRRATCRMRCAGRSRPGSAD